MDENRIFDNYEAAIPEARTPYILVASDSAVIFPGHLSSFSLSDERAVSSLMRAVEGNRDVFFIYGASPESVAQESGARVGTLSKVRQLVKNSRGGLSVIALGIARMEIEGIASDSPCEVFLRPFGEEDEGLYLEAVKSAVRDAARRVAQISPKFFDKDPSLTDVDDFIGEMAAKLYRSEEERQQLLATGLRSRQLEDILLRLQTRCEIAALQKDLELKVRKSIDKNQHEYYLREQIKVLHKELGDDEEEIDRYREKLAKTPLPDNVREKTEREIAKMSRMAPSSPETAVSRGYLDLIFDLPWGKTSQDPIDIAYARKVLDEDHYGLEKVKDRIIEFLAVHALKKDMKAPVLCFVGPPGVGKTSIVKSIARAAKRRFVTMSLGGVRDEAEIRGHRRTYIGSLPGRILSGIREAGVNNPVFLLDEIDKMSADFRGDPASALLEVLDGAQNDHFQDHYLEMPYDLSQVMFITTANTADTIDPPLLDRMEVIELSGYTYHEKLNIAKQYLIPKQCAANGVAKSKVSFTDEAILRIIQRYTRESGVRSLEREIASVIRKIAVKLVEADGNVRKFRVTENNLTQYLDKEKYAESVCGNKDEVGAVTGLAWTSAGGTTLDVEVTVLKGGKGEIKLTGNLGDVMKESAAAALSVVRARADAYNVDPRVFTDCDIHIHVPEGAVPKDGPSAGITIATAIMSALSGRAAASDVAMTGEITLRGKVLPIGGLKEKSLAALRFGKKRILIPDGNVKDLDDVPAEVKDHMMIIPVATIDEVFGQALR